MGKFIKHSDRRVAGIDFTVGVTVSSLIGLLFLIGWKAYARLGVIRCWSLGFAGNY